MVRNLSVWAILDGRQGNNSQVLGIAERLTDCPTTFKHHEIEGGFQAFLQRRFADGGDIQWPDIAIAAGGSAYLLPQIKHLSENRVFILGVQVNPGLQGSKYDLIVNPLDQYHYYQGTNVVCTYEVAHRISPQRLEEARTIWQEQFGVLSSPRVVVLIGGDSIGGGTFTTDNASLMCEDLNGLFDQGHAGSFLVSTSHRTRSGIAEVIKEKLKGLTFLYDYRKEGGNNNPYAGLLAHAEVVIVTGDSRGMVMESCFTGNPVYVYSAGDHHVLPDHEEAIRQHYLNKSAKEFENYDPSWQPTGKPKDVAGEIAEEVHKRFAERETSFRQR